MSGVRCLPLPAGVPLLAASIVLLLAGCPEGPVGDPDDDDDDSSPAPLAITVVEPDGVDDAVNTSFTIRWEEEGASEDGLVSLYWDEDGSGEDGELIVASVAAADTADAVLWDTSSLDEGQYWVYAVLEDGGETVTDYGAGPVSVDHGINQPPSIIVVEPDGLDDVANTSFLIVWTDDDSDDDARISIHWDTDDTGQDGTLITSDIPEDDVNDTLTWDTTGLADGEYWIYATIADTESSTTTYSPGPVTVDHGTNQPPLLTILQPDGVGDEADQSFTITWQDDDPEEDASIALYWDDDASGGDGSLIVSGLSEDDNDDSWTWDTTALADGEYWVYGVIDDGNGQITAYSAGAVTVFHDPCVDLPPSGELTVDVPTVDVVIDVTLDGAPLSPANTGDNNEGEFVLVDSVSGATTNLGEVWNDVTDTLMTPFQVRLVGGFYDIYFQAVNPGDHWPANDHVLLQAGVDLTAPQSLIVDVPTVDVVIDVTLDGAPLSPANTGDSDEGEFILVDSGGGGDYIGLGEVWNDVTDTLLVPYELKLVGGVYDVYFQAVNSGDHWPGNDSALLQAGVNLTAPQTLTVDVPTVDVVIDVTLDGAPLSPVNTGDSNEGAFMLVESTGDGGSIQLNDVWNDVTDTLLTPYEVCLLGGDYDIYFQAENPGDHWPANDNALLMSGVNLSYPQTLTVDVPTVDVTIDVTLDGAPLSPANTGDSNEGEFALVGTMDEGTIALNEVWNDVTDMLLTPYDVRLIGGDYDVYFQAVNPGDHWPANDNALLMAGVDLSYPQSLTVDVPTVDVTIDVTLDGAPLSPANTDDNNEGEFTLVGTADEGTVALYEVWNDVTDTLLTPYDVLLIGGDYDIYFQAVNPGDHWPANDNALLMTAVDLTYPQTLTVDVPTVDVTIDVTLDGAPLSPANTGDSNEGEFTLVGTADEGTVALYEVWNDVTDTLLTPYELLLLAGTYDIHFQAVNPGDHWPANEDVYLQCVNVQ